MWTEICKLYIHQSFEDDTYQEAVEMVGIVCKADPLVLKCMLKSTVPQETISRVIDRATDNEEVMILRGRNSVKIYSHPKGVGM